ncbi:hypothetical protein [Paragemmobacter ruber]|uniref:Uncharacterized protein n=1 Tax=Paragemmobacter ruber TaxID=1985673 RepID=A0ABW9Y1M3_9RHOB|nr:hypothetical protein [Rhodobacter ruber]NBE06407.1 hypothetical protein [Rhodobacter ruber]
MRRAMLTFLLALPLLAACQLSLPGSDRRAAPTADVTGGTITTTSLDAAPAPSDLDPSAPDPAIATERPAAAEAEVTADAPPGEPPADAAGAPPGDAVPPAPVVTKSPSQIACEDDDGIWARAGSGGGMACVRTTRDAGRQCSSKTDCQGECLARSRTCAPVQPLFGCNAVLMDNGAEVNLCIE